MKRYAAVFAASLLVVVFMLSGSTPIPASSVEVGKKAPSFSLKNYDGKEYTLDGFLKNKHTVLMFIATECPVSNAYNDRMASIAKDYSRKNIAFVGINSNKQEDVDAIREHAKKNGFPFPVLKDWDNVVADAYGAQCTPEIYVVNDQGVLEYHGRIDDSKNASNIKTNDLRETLDALVAGKPVPRSETKAFGCSIKRVKKES